LRGFFAVFYWESRVSFTVLVELTIKSEFADSYAVRLKAAFPQTRAFEGCEQIVAYRDQQTPGKFFVLEQWISRTHYERYIDWRRSSGTFDQLAAWSESPMGVRFLEVAA
jgi:quinol monooxygenase YgiN